jgi:hypothetical protein
LELGGVVGGSGWGELWEDHGEGRLRHVEGVEAGVAGGWSLATVAEAEVEDEADGEKGESTGPRGDAGYGWGGEAMGRGAIGDWCGGG